MIAEGLELGAAEDHHIVQHGEHAHHDDYGNFEQQDKQGRRVYHEPS